MLFNKFPKNKTNPTEHVTTAYLSLEEVLQFLIS